MAAEPCGAAAGTGASGAGAVTGGPRTGRRRRRAGAESRIGRTQRAKLNPVEQVPIASALGRIDGPSRMGHTTRLAKQRTLFGLLEVHQTSRAREVRRDLTGEDVVGVARQGAETGDSPEHAWLRPSCTLGA